MILVDSREPKSLVKRLAALTDVTVACLPCGDVAWYDIDNKYIVVERKEVSDFLNSIMDGRLEDQIDRLKEEADFPVVVLEGIEFPLERKVAVVSGLKPLHKGVMAAPFRGSEFNTAAFLGELWALTYSAGVSILPTSCEEETGMLLAIAYSSSQKESHGKLYTGTRWISAKADPVLACVAAIPGVGVELGGRLLAHFPTLEEIAVAGVSQLKEVQGIGEIRARGIYEFFRRGRK